MIPEVPWWARRFRPRKPREPLSRFAKMVFAVLVVGVGAVMVVLVFVPAFRFAAEDRALDERGARVVGVVDSVDPKEQVKYERMRYHYTVDGRTYRGSANYTDPSMVGRKINLVYDPENPGNSRVDESNSAAAVRESGSEDLWVSVFGGLMVAAAVVWFMRRQPWWIKRRRKWRPM
jgi:hypothetical protein